ncbi:MAG: hypothetical protein JO359_10615 [Candidatus Eremiobacteraeota bacterium]|nr:hypothetical protein [Candidatus Eremiobacteraeota bacterium]
MEAATHMPPCDRFTILESRQTDRLSRCDVCEHAEEDHESSGRRVLSGGEVEALRRQMLIEKFDRQEEGRRRHEGNGESSSS